MRQPLFIAHRGLINGPDDVRENHPGQIHVALDNAFDVEVDVWYKKKKFYLGHDEPKYEVPPHFFINNKMWCHAKDSDALFALASIQPRVHFFYHDDDKYTMTSMGYIWAYPGVEHDENTIVHLRSFREFDKDLKDARGFVSKYINNIRNEYFKLL